MTTKLHEDFISLVKLGIGICKDTKISENIEWPAIQALAYQHGLIGVVVDGIEKLPATHRPPQELLLQWIGEVMQSYEVRYQTYEKAIVELACFYNSHGYKMMVLKGYACSLDWPKPEHRPCGDIDIWLFGKQKEADADVVKEKGIIIDKSHHHHTVFNWGDYTVENHYDFINVHHLKGNVELEKIFKDLGQDDSRHVVLKGEKVYLSSPNLQALFLLKHMIAHFVGGMISLRQLLDWAFFIKNHGKEVDWKWFEDVMNKFGMTAIFNIFNAICIEDLGFDSSIFPQAQFNPSNKDRVFNDILEPEFSEKRPKSMLARMEYKTRRWYANGWKHDLCYNESRWSAFWNGIWNHMLKPASI